MTPAEYGQHLAAGVTITDEQAEAAARILASIDDEAVAA